MRLGAFWRQVFFCINSYTFCFQRLHPQAITRGEGVAKGAVINVPSAARRGFCFDNGLGAAKMPRHKQAEELKVGIDINSLPLSAQIQVRAKLDEQKRGADWVPAYVAGLVNANPMVRAVVVDVGSPAAAIVDDLVKLKVKVTSPRVRDVGAGCARLVDGIVGGSVWHTGQVQMTVALGSARKRPLGSTEMWAWNRKNPTADITPVVAATLALWGAQNSTVKKPTRSGGGRRVVSG